MATAEKFTFNNVFELTDDAAAESGAVRYTQVYSREELDAARDEGMCAGAAQERTTSERLGAEALTAISERLPLIAQQQATALEAYAKEATAVALAIARKVAPHLMRQQPEVEVEGMIADCLQQVLDEPRVVVRVSDALLDGLKERIDEIAAGCSFAGNIVLLADASLTGSNCTVEWADGGAERDTDAIWAQIESRIAKLKTGPDIAPDTPQPNICSPDAPAPAASDDLSQPAPPDATLAAGT